MEIPLESWPLHDIAIINIVWRMAYKEGVGGGYYIPQQSRNRIVIVWAMQVGEGNQRMIDSCIRASKRKNIL